MIFSDYKNFFEKLIFLMAVNFFLAVCFIIQILVHKESSAAVTDDRFYIGVITMATAPKKPAKPVKK